MNSVKNKGKGGAREGAGRPKIKDPKVNIYTRVSVQTFTALVEESSRLGVTLSRVVAKHLGDEL